VNDLTIMRPVISAIDSVVRDGEPKRKCPRSGSLGASHLTPEFLPATAMACGETFPIDRAGTEGVQVARPVFTRLGERDGKVAAERWKSAST